MIRSIVVSDGGAALERVTSSLRELDGVEIVRHLGWRRPPGPAIAALQPDLIFIDEPAWTALPLAVIRDARCAAPAAAVVVGATEPTVGWLADALQAGATAVVPAVADEPTLGLVVHEALETSETKREAVRLRWAA